MIHELKIEKEWFDAILRGDKRAELRALDRPYVVGDILALNEVVGLSCEYTGRSCAVMVTNIVKGCPYLHDGYGMLSFAPCNIERLD